MCQWEGTRAAKERYEREAGVEVRTTTADDVEAAAPGDGPRAVFEDLSRPASVGTASSSNGTLIATPDKTAAEPKHQDSPSSAPEEDFMDLLRSAMQSRLSGDASAVSPGMGSMAEGDLGAAWRYRYRPGHEHNPDPRAETFRALQQDTDIMSRSPTPQSPADSYHEANTLDRVEARSTPVATENPMAHFLRDRKRKQRGETGDWAFLQYSLSLCDVVQKLVRPTGGTIEFCMNTKSYLAAGHMHFTSMAFLTDWGH